jgi:hypothetical protein
VPQLVAQNFLQLQQDLQAILGLDELLAARQQLARAIQKGGQAAAGAEKRQGRGGDGHSVAAAVLQGDPSSSSSSDNGGAAGSPQLVLDVRQPSAAGPATSGTIRIVVGPGSKQVPPPGQQAALDELEPHQQDGARDATPLPPPPAAAAPANRTVILQLALAAGSSPGGSAVIAPAPLLAGAATNRTITLTVPGDMAGQELRSGLARALEAALAQLGVVASPKQVDAFAAAIAKELAVDGSSSELVKAMSQAVALMQRTMASAGGTSSIPSADHDSPALQPIVSTAPESSPDDAPSSPDEQAAGSSDVGIVREGSGSSSSAALWLASSSRLVALRILAAVGVCLLC